MQRRIRSVSDVVREIDETLYRAGDVWLEGEVSNLRPSARGHYYFTVKDEAAQLSVVIFSSAIRQFRFAIEDGMQLVLRGRLGIYERSGTFQLKADYAEPAGIGALQLAFEQMKKRLEAEGLFDASRKRPLPMFPERIAIVTSPHGAAIRDVLNVLGRRFAGLHTQIYPVTVQGERAAREIASAIEHLSTWQQHDVLIVCRGGGSLEDLWPFNEERVARAISDCSIPVISGVGHETDFTITDFVADLRAPTPSAAAELVVRAKDEIVIRVQNAHKRIIEVVQRRVNEYRQELRHLTGSDGLHSVPLRIQATRQRLQTRRVALTRLLDSQARILRDRLTRADGPLIRFRERAAIPEKKQRVSALESALLRSIDLRMESARGALRTETARLEAVSPLSVLSRGYAIAYRFEGRKRKPVLDASRISIGQKIEVQLRRGRLDCTVDSATLGLESVWPDNTETDDVGSQEGRTHDETTEQ